MSGLNEAAGARRTFNAGVAVAVVTSLLIVWTTVVHDDGNGVGFFMVIMSALVGAFAASFRAAGMARAMAGVAVMQALLGSFIATAPSTASLAGGASRVLLSCGFFAALWLVSAAFFRFAARSSREAVAH